MTSPFTAGAPGPTTPPDTRQRSGQLFGLSGVAFGVLLLLAWFLSGGDAPDYTATDEAWTTWADANRARSGVGGFLILLAVVALLHFAGAIRSAVAGAGATFPGAVQLARTAFAGAVVGGTGIAMAIVIVGAATSEGAHADPVVSRAVVTASTGPYLVAAMGFAALLGAAGLLTVRHGAFPRWTGIVAMIGAVAFVITFLTLIAGTGKDSVFGYGFLPGILALVTWSIATGMTRRRALDSGRPS
jgi:hypothetical protein